MSLPRFSPPAFFAAVQQHRVTFFSIAPPVALWLVSDPKVKEADLSSVRRALCAAAPLDEALQQKASVALGAPIIQAFGSSEVAATHFSPLRRLVQSGGRDTADVVSGSIGRPLPGVERRVVDPETGVVVDVGAEGELQIRSPQTFQGYLYDPRAMGERGDDHRRRVGAHGRLGPRLRR